MVDKCFDTIEKELGTELAYVIPVYTGPDLTLEEAKRSVDVLEIDMGPGENLLHYAALQNDLGAINSILWNALTPGVPPIEARCAMGWTAVFFAAYAGQAGALLALIKAGAVVTGRDDLDRSALHLAALRTVNQRPYCKVIEILLTAGADVNALCWKSRSPLQESLYHNADLEGFLLLRSGADVNLVDADQHTAMHLACLRPCDVYADDVLAVICALGADPEAVAGRGETALHILVEQLDTFDMVKTLHSFHPDLNFSPRDDQFNTPLHLLPAEIDETFGYLIEHGADVEAKNQDGDTPMHVFAVQSYDDEACLHCLGLLLLHGAEMDSVNKNGFTPLVEACSIGNLEAEELLRAEYEKRAQEREVCTAFSMGLQKRLGVNSIVSSLNPEITRMVLAFIPGQRHTKMA
ncbi:ankyrin repeat-containing domain protein [Baffinella frigidus]|nr:ankyrin repeat-containing domain protein [Cryptophyta sp. CCMP2293]